MAAFPIQGTIVRIQRSNGRIQEAHIIRINEGEGIASVGFVDGVTMLEKEIVISDLFKLNPELFNGNSKAIKVQGSNKSPSVCKKSPVVNEIEKIEKKREERRANVKALKIANVPSKYKYLTKMISDFRSKIVMKPLNSKDVFEAGTICVCVRKRPVSDEEIGRGDVDIITIPNKNTIVLHENRQKVDQTEYLENHSFKYDYVFDENATNDVVYKFTVKPLLKCMFNGGQATCFTYGQTGSGKTFTMEGRFTGSKVEGIYNFVARDLFQLAGDKYEVFVSFFELYNCKILDLLKKNSELKLLEEKKVFHVVGLSEIRVKSVEEMLRCIHKGISTRSSGQTKMNANSSRSHAILQIFLKKPKSLLVHGKISLIDLAGNERAADMDSNDFNVRREASDINTSLLALKECIRALVRQESYVPFRSSKLTSILRDCFTGNKARSCMITTVAPTQISTKQTLNSLRYADFIYEIDSQTPKTALEMDNDLQYVSLSNTDLPEKWVEQQEVMQELSACEDSISQHNKELILGLTESLSKYTKLYENASNPHFEITDEYMRRVSKLLEYDQRVLSNFAGKINQYRVKKEDEERLHIISGQKNGKKK